MDTLFQAPHIAPTHGPDPGEPIVERAPKPGLRLWTPKRILITKAARDSAVAAHARKAGAALGAEIVELSGNAIRGLRGETERETYKRAKSTLAIVNAPPSKLRFQPIPPSADFRLDLAVGCPAHCQYCYLAGSLKGPPVTRAYANLDEIFAAIPDHIGQGTITSKSKLRRDEGTTFEASCYTDPLGIEHLTGSLARLIEHIPTVEGAGLRFTTKFADVDGLLGLAHRGRTRVRLSVNCETVVRKFEGGTHGFQQRLAALGRLARAGYPVGLTVAPIMPVADWQAEYAALFAGVAAQMPPGADLTVELITHRYTPGSRDVILGWYPGTSLEMDDAVRTVKRNKFGGRKYVYPKDKMREMKAWFEAEVARTLPEANWLYWT